MKYKGWVITIVEFGTKATKGYVTLNCKDVAGVKVAIDTYKPIKIESRHAGMSVSTASDRLRWLSH